MYPQEYKKRTETAKKEYLKQLAAYRASLVSQVGTAWTLVVTLTQMGNSRGETPLTGSRVP